MSNLYDALKQQIQEREKQSKLEAKEPNPAKDPPAEAVPVIESETVTEDGQPESDIEPVPDRVCPFCRTVYDDLVLMRRHLKRMHGIGIKNLNQPSHTPRKLPVVHSDEDAPRPLVRESDWGRRWKQQ